MDWDSRLLLGPYTKEFGHGALSLLGIIDEVLGIAKNLPYLSRWNAFLFLRGVVGMVVEFFIGDGDEG
jgi:hypothetical protein